MGSSRRKTHLIAMTAAMALGLSERRALGLLFWDINGATAGAGSATPSGTWGVDNFWSTSSTGVAATGAWNEAETAVFAAGTDATGSYTVTVSGTQYAGEIRFDEGITTLSSGVLTAGFTITPGSRGVTTTS